MSKVPAAAIASRHSVRYRLLAIALLPMLVVLPLLLGVALYRWDARFDSMLVSKVNSDLTIAHEYMHRILRNTQASLASMSRSTRFESSLASDAGSGEALDALLATMAREEALDFLYVVREDGAIVSTAHPLASKSLRTDWPIIRAALNGQARTGIDVFTANDLAAISPSLAEKAKLTLVSTPTAGVDHRTVEARGMVVHSASPITLPDGRHAALVAGILLNRNLGFIDTINTLVYHDQSLPEDSRGTASLFLGDVRISTNVRMFEGRRALGTRASAAVSKTVLGEGRTWLDRAYVVNDWYVSAYEPVQDSYGKRVGMLYVGFLEKPFFEAKRETLVSIIVAFLLVAGLTVPLFLRWAADIFRPLERMTNTIARVESGDLDARTGHVEDKDEIGQVATHLDHLLDQVQSRDRQLRQWNEDLNARVEERTRNLLQTNQQLEETTRQLVMSEKLAVIGEITAGIAHEINNPLAVMQGNLEIVRDRMGDRAEQAQVEFRLLDEQIHRIGQIISDLLQFAKPAEYAGYMDRQDLSEVVSGTLPLAQHMLKKTAITVEHEYGATRQVAMSRTELQQVLVNLIVNAIHAMPNGGRLRLRTTDSDNAAGRPGAAVEVVDNGMGIPAELVAKVFDPFFSTKQHGGTGLGLSISQMLVSRQGGQISVSSEVGKGTTFTVWLPEATG